MGGEVLEAELFVDVVNSCTLFTAIADVEPVELVWLGEDEGRFTESQFDYVELGFWRGKVHLTSDDVISN